MYTRLCICFCVLWSVPGPFGVQNVLSLITCANYVAQCLNRSQCQCIMPGTCLSGCTVWVLWCRGRLLVIALFWPCASLIVLASAKVVGVKRLVGMFLKKNWPLAFLLLTLFFSFSLSLCGLAFVALPKHTLAQHVHMQPSIFRTDGHADG